MEKKGEKGDSNVTRMKKSLESFFILPDEAESKRDSSDLKLKLSRVKKDGRLIESTHLLQPSPQQVIKVSKECTDGTRVFMGNCRWDLLRFDSQPSWCFAEDFPVGKRGCTDCITSVETTSANYEGTEVKVATRITFSNADQSEDSYDLHERSCSILDTREMEPQDLTKCGFFCFFQKLDSLYESETKFTCRYIPPSAFGIGLNNPFFSSTDLQDKIQSITIEVVCSDKIN